MTNRKRFTAALFAVLVLFAMAASLFVLAHEADHDCTGRDCSVCALMETCRNALRSLGGLLIFAAALFACVCSAFSASGFFRSPASNATPISLKVKLLN